MRGTAIHLTGRLFSFLTIAFASAWSAAAQPVQWAGNGHYYEFIRTNIDYRDAWTNASQRSFNGWPGHLATITSAAENNFVTTTFRTGATADFAWLGGREPADDGRWFWDAGPEAGIIFSTNKVAAPPFNYANWGGIEPNDNKPNEDYLMMNIGSDFAGITLGQWADAAPQPNPTDPVIGYIVEYEAPVKLSIARAGTNTVEIKFLTIANWTHQLKGTTNLPATNWSNVGAAFTGNGSNAVVPDSVLGSSRRFYRLEISP